MRRIVLLAFVLATSAAMCVVVAAGSGVLVAMMVYLNTGIWNTFPWFIAPAFALSLAILILSRRWYEPLSSVRPPSTAISALASVLVGIAITVVTLLSATLLSHDALVHGRIELVGDQYRATAAIRAAVSLTVPVMASFYEEAGVRGALQLRLQHVIGPLWAEILAGTAFVLLHGFTIARSPFQVTFLAFAAFANGRLAAVTQTVKYSVLSHGLSNGILVVTYAVLRGANR
jgi:membrane protease YdiL (CAAX protease family)